MMVDKNDSKIAASRDRYRTEKIRWYMQMVAKHGLKTVDISWSERLAEFKAGTEKPKAGV